MSNPELSWFPIATAPTDGTVYLATDWKQFRAQNQPPGHWAGTWVADGVDWRGRGHYEVWATHWTPLPIKPKHLKG
jgi:hypothetical protein